MNSIRIGSLTGENEALQESKASLANELADLREQLTIASENCAALATENDKREQLLQELRTELKELKMRLAGQQAEHKAVRFWFCLSPQKRDLTQALESG